MKHPIALAAAVATLGLTTLCVTARADVPDAIVTGPIAALASPGDPSHDYPFFATDVDLASFGYVEEEYFIEGTANRYNTSTPLATATIIDGDHPYRTRILVRRPTDAEQFNGTVVLEWNNVTAGYDLEVQWLLSREHFLRAGYAWVGVSAQRVGVQGGGPGSLKVWGASRYATLDVTSGGTITNDALSYDIFSQAAQAVRSPAGVDPMGGLFVQRVLAAGASQSAGRLVTYYNAIHPLAGVVDAVLVFIGGGRVRTDLGAPVFKVLSETDVVGQLAASQPDGPTFRNWQVAGTSHFDLKQGEGVAPLLERDGVAGVPTTCTLPPFSQIPMHYAVNAVYDHMVSWVELGTQPPTAPPIALTSVAPISIVRDAFGNSLGGIRLAQHAVPTATNTGQNSGPIFCFLFGSNVPFDDATLAALYRNHGQYVSPVAQVTDMNLEAGYILTPDAAETITQAAQSAIGKKKK
jgi:hypothetical protein